MFSLFVSRQFQVLFHSVLPVLFTFPSRYWFAIGPAVYLALEDGSPRFPRLWVEVLRYSLGYFGFRLRGFHSL